MDADQYVIECIRNKSKYSGKKVKTLGGLKKTPTELYMEANNIHDQPTCAVCGETTFVKVISKGFPKYCSKKCYRKALSLSNKRNNRERNKNKSKQLKADRSKKFELAKELYLNNEQETIESVSKQANLPIYAVRNYFFDVGCTDKNRQTKQRKKYFQNKFSKQIRDLNQRDWNYYTAEEIGKRLGVSANYVSKSLRERGKPLTRSPQSSHERKLIDSLREENVISNDRSIIKPYELDIVIPDYRLAIEINGLYWHSKKPKNYHLDKLNMSLEMNYHLLQFYDFEIDNDFDKVLSIINSHLRNNKRIFARNTVVKEITSSEYKQFCETNHIQNCVNASIKLGLFFQEELVAIMSFGKSRFNRKYQYELLRYCSKLNVNVIGGSSKLFKYFQKTHSPNSIISYAQRRIFSGKMYESLGMSHQYNSPPSYMWVNSKGDKYTRYQCQPHKLGAPEKEYMEAKNFHKVYDCGQSVFVWNNQK